MPEPIKSDLDPDYLEVLEASLQRGGRPFHQQTVDEARQFIVSRIRSLPDDVSTLRIENHCVTSQPDLPAVPVRIYTPPSPYSRVIVYAHGGGWALGNLDTIDPLLKRLALLSDACIVSVDYRLAPEHPYPAALHDYQNVLNWVLLHYKQPIVTAGDSAGANLAASATFKAGATARQSISGLILIYPVLDIAEFRPSYDEISGNLYPLTRRDMEWFINMYVPVSVMRLDPDVSPIRSKHLSHAPKTLMITAGHDPLRDEGYEFAEKLRAFGVEVRHKNFPGVGHGFLGLWDLSRSADEALIWVAESIKRF